MGWSTPKPGIKFRVVVFIIDDTYWDDGNRTTSRDHDFATLAEAVDFLLSARKNGWYETVSRETHKPLRRHLAPDSFCLFRYDGDWLSVEDTDILTLLSLVTEEDKHDA